MTPMIIGISGATNSGKSSLARHTINSFPDMLHIEMDDFYKDEHEAPFFEGIPNWDHPDSVHFDTLIDALRALKGNQSTDIPVYSKPESKRVGIKPVMPSPWIIVEGTLIFSSQIICDLCDLTVFIRSTSDTILRHFARRDRNYSINTDYLSKIIFPDLDTYNKEHASRSDITLDGSKHFDDLASEFFDHLTMRFPKYFTQ